jgi:hypothetical protein
MLDRPLDARTTFAGRCALALTLVGALGALQGCSSDDTTSAPTDGGPTEGGACPAGGGPLPGMAADHCMGMFQSVGACMTEPADGGGAGTDGGGEMMPEPAVGTSNDDDDCKYHVSFTNDCVQQGGTGTTFTVTLTSLTNNMAPAPGAKAYVEAFLTDTHPAGGNTASTETSPGVYKVGPVIFDQPGKWTVRFHFFGDCSDIPDDSPHAHAAFFINVP